MTARTKGVFAQWEEEQQNKGRKEGKKEIIEKLLKTKSIEEISQMLEMDVSEIQELLEIS